MKKEEIEELMENEEFAETFAEVLIDEIMSDDEPYDKKGRQILRWCIENDGANDLLMSLCGWSLETLVEKTQERLKVGE